MCSCSDRLHYMEVHVEVDYSSPFQSAHLWISGENFEESVPAEARNTTRINVIVKTKT